MDQSLVSCTTCSICDFLKLVESLFYLLVALSFVVAIFFVVLNGFLRIVSIGDRILTTVAKRGLRLTIIGFAVCLVAWLSVYSIYNVLGVKGDNWWNLNCEVSLAGNGQKETTPSRYSEFKTIKPLKSINEIVSGEKKVGVLDLNEVDENNLYQDLNLLFPGENIKFLAGYKDLSQDDLENLVAALNGSNIDPEIFGDLTNKITELISAEMLDGGLYINGKDNLSNINVSDYDPNDYNARLILDKVIKMLIAQTIQRVVVYKSGNSEIGLEKCIESDGNWIEFYNGCASRKQICGNENLKCTSITNKTNGCQCAEGSCLVNGKCTVRSTANNEKKDDDGDGIKNNLDKCAGTPKSEAVNKDSQSVQYGCSCSQLDLINHSCPSTRCEGPNLVTYPASGNDTCTDGKISQYSCNPLSSAYNATCNQVQNMPNLTDKENEIKKNNDLYKQLKDWLDKGGSSNQGSGSGSGNNKGSNNTGGNNTGSNDTGSSSTGDGTSTDTSGPAGKTVPAEDFKPSGDFNAWAKCVGLKEGEIPQNGMMVGRCRDANCNTMEIRYLSPEGKVIGNNGDTGGQALIGYPNPGKGGFAKAAQQGQAAIYATQAQNHVPDGSGKPTPLTMRGDKRIWSNGKVDSIVRYNIHGGQQTAGCLGLGGKNNFWNFMNQGQGGPWDVARSYGDGKMDGVTQGDPNRYKPYRTNDTVLFTVLPYGSMNEICGKIDPYQAIDTLKKQSGYDQYDPKWLNKK